MYGIVSLLMAFCVSLCCYTSFPSLSHFSKTLTRKHVRSSFPLICAVQSGEPGGSSQSQPKSSDASSSSSTTAPKTLPKKPVYSSESSNQITIYLDFICMLNAAAVCVIIYSFLLIVGQWRKVRLWGWTRRNISIALM